MKFKPNLSESVSDKFYSEFIALIEETKLAFGGGFGPEYWQGFITAWERYCSPTNEQRKKIEKWLAGSPEISEFEVGKLADAWYDNK